MLSGSAPGISGAPSPSLAQQLGLGIRRIIIDPGHGGKDPGAIAANGLREKDVVLSVALKLAATLRRQLGCEVLLTRERDVFIPLEERTAIANTSNSDLFVSVHANAARSPETAGVETYFLDLTDDRDAMRLAAFENATSAAKMSDLRHILADLLQNSKKEESARLAGLVQKQMAGGLGLRDHGVKKAPFYVLVGARMPAILAEIAFLSNPEEAKRLQSDAFREAVAVQLAAGVISYVNGNTVTAHLTVR
jgi:N-acetylmuramoyl-L-alanine amidase